MLWVPQKGILRVQHNLGNVGTTTLGTAATTGAASSTKGTPAQLLASTNFDSYWIKILASNYGSSATTSQCCVDIMIGGSGVEEVIIPDLLAGFCCAAGTTLGEGPKVWEFPLYIPANTRISARAAGDRTSTAINVAVILYGGAGYPPFRVGSRILTYGITTVPAGTDVTEGASGAEGSWTQITASTSEAHFAFVPSYHPTDGDTTLTPVKNVFVDLGFGAATEELALGIEQSFVFRYGSGELCDGPYNSIPIFQDLPASTRLVARASLSGAADTGPGDMAIHAVS